MFKLTCKRKILKRRLATILLLGVVTMLAACRGGSGGGSSSGSVDTSPVRISFNGVGTLGIFDPSVTEDPITGRLWMSYSNVSVSVNSPSLWGVGLRLAYSDDAGLTWQDAGVVVDPFRDVTVGPLTVTSPGEPDINAGSLGTWQSETSTLVYDAAATDGKPWKILWHQYLLANHVSYFVSYGWIAMKSAATPQGLATATPVKLFGGVLLKTDGEITTTPAFAPIGGAPQIALNTKHSDLNNCIFAEPGIVATSAYLYLTLDCQLLGTNPPQPYVTLFRCANPCAFTSAAGWEYIGRIIGPSDAQAIDAKYKNLGATAFTEKAGSYYLIATPVDINGTPADTADDRYDGCLVYRFTDLATGTLQRSAGVLTTVQQVNGAAGSHHGACAHHAKLTYGILYSQIVLPVVPPADFRVYQSRVNIP